MDIDEQERIDAVNRHLKGDKSVDICKDANRSKKWLIGWVNRFKTGEEEWYKSQSNAPKKHGRKTRKDIESTIVNIRKALMEGKEQECCSGKVSACHVFPKILPALLYRPYSNKSWVGYGSRNVSLVSLRNVCRRLIVSL